MVLDKNKVISTINYKREFKIKGSDWYQVSRDDPSFGRKQVMREIKEAVLSECLAMSPPRVPVKEITDFQMPFDGYAVRQMPEGNLDPNPQLPDGVCVYEAELATRADAKLLGLDPFDELNLPIVGGNA